MKVNFLKNNDRLPLTCSRKGTCCHGNQVFLNPWEIAVLAHEKEMTPRAFREQHCNFLGVQLRFGGKRGFANLPQCDHYIENFGCSVHPSRPLACRLFPIGRSIQYEKAQYIFQGEQFPCFNACPEVSELPHLSVAEYIKGQQTALFEKAQDTYLEIMQNLADVSFILLLDTNLEQSQIEKAIEQWIQMGNDSLEILAKRQNLELLDLLMSPEIIENLDDPSAFAQKHLELLQEKIDSKFSNFQSQEEISKASVEMMALALYLAKGIGADPQSLSQLWVETARRHVG